MLTRKQMEEMLGLDDYGDESSVEECPLANAGDIPDLSDEEAKLEEPAQEMGNLMKSFRGFNVSSAAAKKPSPLEKQLLSMPSAQGGTQTFAQFFKPKK